MKNSGASLITAGLSRRIPPRATKGLFWKSAVGSTFQLLAHLSYACYLTPTVRSTHNLRKQQAARR